MDSTAADAKGDLIAQLSPFGRHIYEELKYEELKYLKEKGKSSSMKILLRTFH